MIYEIAKEISAEFKAKGVPYPVLYGPERAPRNMVDTRIVIERNRDGSDELAAPKARFVNPRMIGTRWLACRCTIFARSTLAGAGVHDHERIADQIVDKFTVALHKTTRVRKNLYRLASARFLSAEALNLQGLEAWPGVVYQIEFAVDRGVSDTTWTGTAKPTAAIGGDGITIGTSIGDLDGSDGSATLPSAETEISE